LTMAFQCRNAADAHRFRAIRARGKTPETPLVLSLSQHASIRPLPAQAERPPDRSDPVAGRRVRISPFIYRQILTLRPTPMSHDTHKNPAEADATLSKSYDPHAIETPIYQRWEKAGYFKPGGKGPSTGSGQAYCIMI